MSQPPGWLIALADDVGTAPQRWFTASSPAPSEGARASAVLLLFGPGCPEPGGEGIDVVLTQRARTLRSHPGQVAFPGGSRDPGDTDLVATALREAQEEIGLSPQDVRVLGTLPSLHIPVSRFDVTPVLGWWTRPSQIWAREPAEVDRVVRAPLSELLEPAHRFRVRHPSGYSGPAFRVRDILVWGFTAGVLDRIFEVAGLTRPWDDDDVRDLPA